MSENGKWGIIDENGNYIVIPQYDFIQGYSDGLYCVGLSNKFGFIDSMGNIIIGFKFDYDPKIHYYIKFHNGIAKIQLNENQYFLIDKDGDKIAGLFDGPPYQYWQKPNSNRILVERNEKCGYIDYNGKVVIDFNYKRNYCGKFNENKAYIRDEKDDNYYIININGERISDGLISVTGYSDGICLIQKAYYDNGLRYTDNKFIAINENGQELFTFNGKNVKSIHPFCNGYAKFTKELNRTGTYSEYSGYINTKGEEIIPCIYKYADNFYGGLAKVNLEGISSEHSNFINDKNEMVIQKDFYIGDFDESGLTWTQHGIIDNKGFQYWE